MVLADSHGISRAPCYSGYSHALFYFRLQDFHLLWCSFQLLCLACRYVSWLSHDPRSKNLWFRLFPVRSPLLGKSLLLSLPPATKMFQFAGFAAPIYVFNWYLLGCPIRTSPDQCLLPAPRSLSSVATSFFASVCLGIHR